MAEQIAVPLRIQANGLEALAAYIESVRGQPHVWGQRDCWTFVRDGVRALTQNPTFGSDIPPYDSAFSAVSAFGSTLLSNGVAAYAEPWHIRPVLYSRIALVVPGDVLGWQAPDELVPHFGLVAGRTLWECTVEKGVVGTPLHACLREPEPFDEGLTIYRVAVA